MATSGHSAPQGNVTPVRNQAQGAEYGFPKNQVKGEGGSARVQVSADVADRFEAAKKKVQASGKGVELDQKHKSGMEPLPERARNLTAVAEAKMQSGGKAETRTPDIGFPATKHAD